MAFIENSDYGFEFGASPDGLLVDAKGGLEIKCPRAVKHLNTYLYGKIDDSYILLMQGQMLAGDLEFIDFFSYNNNLATKPIRIFRDEEIIDKIVDAGKQFEEIVCEIIEKYNSIDGVTIDNIKEEYISKSFLEAHNDN